MRTLARTALAFLLIAALGACSTGGDSDTEPAINPADEDLEGFTEGEFDDLPVLPDSLELDPGSRVGGAITASYVVNGGTAANVVDDLQRRLEDNGWRLIEGPRTAGQAVRADFVRERERLEVSAIEASAFEADYDNPIQYSLVLTSDLEDSEDAGS